MLIFLQPTQHTVVLTGEGQTMHVRARVWRHMHVCDREACETVTPCLRRNRRTQLLVLTADGVCVSRLIVLREECLLSTAGIFLKLQFLSKNVNNCSESWFHLPVFKSSWNVFIFMTAARFPFSVPVISTTDVCSGGSRSQNVHLPLRDTSYIAWVQIGTEFLTIIPITTLSPRPCSVSLWK